MKTTFNGTKWYTLRDLADLVYLPYQNLYSMVRVLNLVPAPTHKVDGGNRTYYSVEEVAELEAYFEKYRSRKLREKKLRKVAKASQVQPDLEM